MEHLSEHLFGRRHFLKIRCVEEKKIRMILINTGQFPSYHCHSKEELECQQSEPLLKKQFYLLRPTLLGLEDLQRAKTMHERDTRYQTLGKCPEVLFRFHVRGINKHS